MRMQLSQQAAELLGKRELVIITERVDDVALLIGQMVKMGLPEVLDRHIPRHWTQRGLSWGWTAVIWLASIVTEGDHRNVSVETYLKGMHQALRCTPCLRTSSAVMPPPCRVITRSPKGASCSLARVKMIRRDPKSK